MKAISGDRISVEANGQVTPVLIIAQTEVWKGQSTHNAALIRVGDDFSSRCFKDPHGDLIADVVWLNIVNYPGVITASRGELFEMNTNPDADPQSAYEKKHIAVMINGETMYLGGAEGDLKAGRHIQVIGVDLRNGKILATRIFF